MDPFQVAPIEELMFGKKNLSGWSQQPVLGEGKEGASSH